MPLRQLADYDRAHGAVVCGCDEAGRGCYAGPLVAAAVRLDYRRLSDHHWAALAALDDSKKLTRAVRERLYPAVLAAASAVAVTSRSAASIDRRGLHRMNLDANRAALAAVATPGAALLADGFQLAPIGDRPVSRVVGGDRTSAAIAAASIVAKVTRDRLMGRLAVAHPGYGFERHAGYGTKAHRDAIGRLGLTAQHRRSFRGLVELAAGA